MKKLKKRAITLIEMIIVMILIATITGAVAYNYRESLNEGRAFKTKEAMSRIETILAIYFAEHQEEVAGYQPTSWQDIISRSALVKNPKDYYVDGWGKPYHVDVVVSETGHIDIKVTSDEYIKYENGKKKK